MKGLIPIFVMMMVALTSCALPNSSSSETSAADASGAESAPPPAPVPLDAVLAAVKTAQTATQLPTSVTPAILSKVQRSDISLWGMADCNPEYGTTSLDDLEPCTVGDPDGAKTLVVIGDSQALQWSGSLDWVGKRNGWKVVVLGKDNCGPATLTYYQYQLKRDFTECDEWQKWRMAQIAELKPAAVLMIGWYGGNTGPDRPFGPDIWRDALIATVKQLPPGVKAALLTNQPHITLNPGDCLARNTNDIQKCNEPASAVIDAEGTAAFRAAADATQSTLIDVTPWFCGDQSCPVVVDPNVVYSGKYHITHDYGHFLSGVVSDALQPAMG